MRSRWSDEEAAAFVERYAADWGKTLAMRTYSSRLVGADPALVLHGGGNSSVKTTWMNVLGDEVSALFVKASGADMATIEPAGHSGLELDYLRRLRALADLSDDEMVQQLRTHLLRADSPTPSIEALVHAFLPARFIDHTHADAVLALTNRPDGEAVAAQAFGDDFVVLPYVTPGFKLALRAAAALAAHPDARGMVWAYHGVTTWGETARESYEAMIDLVSTAEDYVAGEQAKRREAGRSPGLPGGHPGSGPAAGPRITAFEPEQPPGGDRDERFALVMPVLRGLLAQATGDPDRPHRRVILRVLDDADTLAILGAPGAKQLLVTPVLTTDHLIRTKAVPLWVEGLDYSDPAALRAGLETAVEAYSAEYEAYLARNSAVLAEGVKPFDPRPRVVMVPGVGVFCAGPDLHDATIARDITAHAIAVKAAVAEAGAEYRGLPEEELFRMEYRTLQHAKLGLERHGVRLGPAIPAAARGVDGAPGPPLAGEVALVTGAAGAIGTGICEGLLEAGCLVAATDLAGEPLAELVQTLEARFPSRIVGVTLDVTDQASVAEAFAQVARTWGGIDLVIPNAGVAMVASLTELELHRYRKLEQVNVEGTLLVLAEAARLFRKQATGGDIVLVSTKNVFSPGANFGAYSSTKAAAHQLARIASLELAGDDVRVNMVAPDAVFSCGTCRSGLWAEVGPERMKARGLDEEGLESYYQSRNLLKARVTAHHVANGVLFFATRQTPTTGATIPVDGGLPDSTPR